MVKTPEQIRERQICENSIERVINTTITILENLNHDRLSKRVRELIDTNLQDWNELKSVTTWIWDAERNRIFTRRQIESNK